MHPKAADYLKFSDIKQYSLNISSPIRDIIPNTSESLSMAISQSLFEANNLLYVIQCLSLMKLTVDLVPRV